MTIPEKNLKQKTTRGKEEKQKITGEESKRKNKKKLLEKKIKTKITRGKEEKRKPIHEKKKRKTPRKKRR